MKKIGEYTTRGTLVPDSSGAYSERIDLFDGKFDTGYRVIKFKIFPSDMDQATFYGISGKLATDESVTDGATLNAGNNAEIGWTAFNYDATPTVTVGIVDMETSGIVDPDNLIIQDLFVVAKQTQTTPIADLPINYVIELEKYDITDWQGALGMVRNRSQA